MPMQVDEKEAKNGFWPLIRKRIYRFCYTLRFVREIPNRFLNFFFRLESQKIILKNRELAEHITFNAQALQEYLNDLEQIYELTKTNGARMVLLTYPVLTNEDLLGDDEIKKKLSRYLVEFLPCSVKKLHQWSKIYTQAQKGFVEDHGDVILLDAAEEFSRFDKKERLEIFFDFVHLTPYGQKLFAEFIFKKLLELGLIN